MPTLDHSEGNALSFDDSTPAKEVTGWAPIDAGANAYFDYLNIQLSITWGASGDGDATIKRRVSADSGTTDSNYGIDLMDVTYEASGTKVITIQLRHVNYVDIGIYNGNSASEDITISGKWEGLKVSE